ncbi:carbohydrate esterase family 15 protein, partial [Moniliophthora roreri]
MTKRPRGATRPINTWWSKGKVLTEDWAKSGFRYHSTSLCDIEQFRETPTIASARTRLLWNGESDTRLKGTRYKSTFTISRTTGHSEPLGVNVGARSDLQGVDDTTNAPGPRYHSTSAVVTPVELVELPLTTAASTSLRSHV